MQNWEKTLLSQYANSPILCNVLQGMNDAIDPRVQIDQWFLNLWNIDTAKGYGLDVWGRIVGVSRFVQVPDDIDYFGFQTGGLPEHSLPFGSGVFWAGMPATETYELSDDAYRSLIFFKAFANVSAMTIPNLNKLVNKLFGGLHGFWVARGYYVDGFIDSGGEGRAWVEDLGGMAMRYHFDYDLNEYELAIIAAPGVLPHPAGVSVSIATP